MENQVIGAINSNPRRLGGTLAPGLMSIVAAAEAAGWSVRRDNSFVELLNPALDASACVGYRINSRWWCRALPASAAKYQSQSFRVTAPTLMKLLGLSIQGDSAGSIHRLADALPSILGDIKIARAIGSTRSRMLEDGANHLDQTAQA